MNDPQDNPTAATAETARCEPFVEALVRDLRRLSPDLVETGVAETTTARRQAGVPGSLSVLLRQIEVLTGLTPRLVTDLEVALSVREELHPTRLPKRAQLATTPRSYARHDGRLQPVEWLRPEPVVEPDLRPLGFLLFLLDTLRQRLEVARQRVRRYLDDAIPTRDTDSVFGRHEMAILQQLRETVSEADADLHRARHYVLAPAGFRLVATPTLPRPYPRAPVWTTLRIVANELTRPQGALPALMKGLLTRPVHVADVPFLYQRWCGMQVLEALESLGWSVCGDRVPALFLGGAITLREADAGTASTPEIVLWCEPRLTRKGRHESSLYSLRKPEVTPDYVLVTPGPGGRDAFVLDPTLATDATMRRQKGRYLSELAFDALQLVAGVPVLRSPARSWAAAPLRTGKCELSTADGRAGTVPLHPLAKNLEPLTAWLRNITEHARAWTAGWHWR